MPQKSRLHTRNDGIVYENGEHNHAVVHGKAEVENARALMRQDVTNSVQPTRAVSSHGLLNISVEMSNLLPGRESLARDVRRHRQRSSARAHNLTSFARTI